MESPAKLDMTLGFIGGGNMAKAICEGIVRKGLIEYQQIYVTVGHKESGEYWEDMGALTMTDNGSLVNYCDVIFLAVKPQVLPIAIDEMYKKASGKANNKLFVSILAGVTIETLQKKLSGVDGARIIRVMPNTPMMVGEGCTVFCRGKNAFDSDVGTVTRILEASGICKEVPESMIDAIGALSGSGPAFIYLVIEALSDGGVKMGIPRNMATQLAAQTVLGAAKMVLDSGKHPGALKDDVCSPGGTTITGIHALEKGGVRGAIMDAIEVATKKSAELGQKKTG